MALPLLLGSVRLFDSLMDCWRQWWTGGREGGWERGMCCVVYTSMCVCGCAGHGGQARWGNVCAGQTCHAASPNQGRPEARSAQGRCVCVTQHSTSSVCLVSHVSSHTRALVDNPTIPSNQPNNQSKNCTTNTHTHTQTHPHTHTPCIRIHALKHRSASRDRVVAARG
jgi:hypothetical protein